MGGFLEPIGPGASARGDFSADGVPWVRWASANLHFFAVFCGFLAGFCRLFVAIWCFSHPCHVHTFMLITFFPRLWHGNCTAFNAEIAESAEKDRDRGKATANGAAFNAAQPKVPAGRAPFLHGEDAAGHGRSRTPARGAVALPGRSRRAQRKAKIGKGQQGKTVARGLVPRGCRQIQRARASPRATPSGSVRNYAGTRRRGRRGEKQDRVAGNACPRYFL